MGTKEIRAILSAVEEAVQVCDREERVSDRTRQAVSARLRRVRAALRRRVKTSEAGGPA